MKKVHYEVVEHIAWIQMDYQQNMNAIDEAMASELLSAFDESEKDPTVRVIVLCGSGRAFSSGGDIRFFHSLIERNEDVDMSALASLVGKLTLYMHRSRKLIITAVNGVAAGAGANLALSGDFVFCAEDASLIQAFTMLGLVPDTGGGYMLPKMIGPHRAMEYCVSAKPMVASEAQKLGLVYRVCPPSSLIEEVRAFAAQLAAGPLVAYANLKKQIYASCYSDYQHFLEYIEAQLKMNVPQQRT